MLRGKVYESELGFGNWTYLDTYEVADRDGTVFRFRNYDNGMVVSVYFDRIELWQKKYSAIMEETLNRLESKLLMIDTNDWIDREVAKELLNTDERWYKKYTGEWIK